MQFLPSSGRIDTAVWMHYLDANKTAGEEARWQLHKNAASNTEQVLAATPDREQMNPNYGVEEDSNHVQQLRLKKGMQDNSEQGKYKTSTYWN